MSDTVHATENGSTATENGSARNVTGQVARRGELIASPSL
jgi:hypothetical protein